MSITLADQYFLKALDNYEYDIELSVESLNYALSYNESHAAANCLLARILMEKLKDFPCAMHCFEMALLEDPDYVETYKYYSMLLIWMGDFKKAERIIETGMGKTGMPKLIMMQRKATLLETQGKINLAILELKRGRLLSTSTFDFEYFDNELKRLKKKCRRLKSRSRKADK